MKFKEIQVWISNNLVIHLLSPHHFFASFFCITISYSVVYIFLVQYLGYLAILQTY